MRFASSFRAVFAVFSARFRGLCDALRQIVLRKRMATPKVDADDVSAIMVSDAPQMGVVGALRKLNG